LAGLQATKRIPFFFDSQRLFHLREFMNSMNPGSEPFGVLFSGPNGVGKSANTFAAAIHSFARGLPRVYIPKAGEWYICVLFNLHYLRVAIFISFQGDRISH
jgi:hypothetical protein